MELRSKNKVQPNMVYGRFNIKRKSYLHLNARTNKVAIVNKALIYLYICQNNLESITNTILIYFA